MLTEAPRPRSALRPPRPFGPQWTGDTVQAKTGGREQMEFMPEPGHYPVGGQHQYPPDYYPPYEDPENPYAGYSAPPQQQGQYANEAGGYSDVNGGGEYGGAAPYGYDEDGFEQLPPSTFPQQGGGRGSRSGATPPPEMRGGAGY